MKRMKQNENNEMKKKIVKRNRRRMKIMAIRRRN